MHRHKRAKVMREKNAFKTLICTQPADRQQAEQTILKSRLEHSNKTQPLNPKFIWCASPQTAIVTAKVLSDLHESTIPPRPSNIKGGGVHREAYNIWDRSREVDKILTFGNRFGPRNSPRGGSFHNIVASQVQATINMNPDTQLFALAETNELVETAFNNTQPHISEIKLHPDFIGRRLKLNKTYYGQYSTGNESSLDEELRQCCGWIWDYGPFVFLCERHNQFHYREDIRQVFDPRSFPVTTASRMTLHNTDGPAISWTDGFSIYCINGIRVPDFVVEKPHLITPYKINHEQNAEVRRIMVERYKFGEEVSGQGAYIRDSNSERLDHDDQFGTLWRLNINTATSFREEPLVMLEVVNRTPEPDGHFKRYFLRVPPTMRFSHEASAWTFGLDPADYQPAKET